MSLTVLFDLDDTLLENSLQGFMPAYLEAWGRFIAPYGNVDQFLRKLLGATRVMATQQRPDCTLQEIFEEAFFPIPGIETARFQELAETFYKEVFPSLKTITRPIPGAVQTVSSAFERGYRVAITTNPFFPRTAIEQRLEWAGLPVDKYPFGLVPSYETMHFTKPDPAFFAEVLAHLGWPEGPVVVVGDDPERDIVSSQRFGLANFWILGANHAGLVDHKFEPTGQGAIEDLLPWLDNTPFELLLPDLNRTSRLQAVLQATPAVLDNICRDLTARLWRTRFQSEEWSPVEIIAHMCDVEREVNLPRLRKILDEDNPFLPGVDSDRWAEERNYIEQDGAQALHGFMAARMQSINILAAARAEDWQRPARHAIFGRTHLAELVSFTASHDQIHTRQLQKDLLSSPPASPNDR